MDGGAENPLSLVKCYLCKNSVPRAVIHMHSCDTEREMYKNIVAQVTQFTKAGEQAEAARGSDSKASTSGENKEQGN